MVGEINTLLVVAAHYGDIAEVDDRPVGLHLGVHKGCFQRHQDRLHAPDFDLNFSRYLLGLVAEQAKADLFPLLPTNHPLGLFDGHVFFKLRRDYDAVGSLNFRLVLESDS